MPAREYCPSCGEPMTEDYCAECGYYADDDREPLDDDDLYAMTHERPRALDLALAQ